MTATEPLRLDVANEDSRRPSAPLVVQPPIGGQFGPRIGDVPPAVEAPAALRLLVTYRVTVPIAAGSRLDILG